MYVVSYKESCDLIVNTTEKLSFIFLIHAWVVYLVIVYLSVCHPDKYACRHSYFHYIQR